MEVWKKPRCRGPLRDVQSGVVYIPPMARTGVPFKNSITRQPSGGDRFIPDRSAMDFDVAHYLLTESRKENTAKLSPRKEAYRRMLDSTLMPNRNRILAFRGKTDSATTGVALKDFLSENSSNQVPKIVSKRRYIPQSADRTLDAPDIVDDFYLNLLDWGSKNVLSVALGDTIYLWDASVGSVSELLTVDQEDGPITSVSWAPDGQHLAVGLDSSDVQLWDSSSNKLIRTLTGMHQSRVGSLAWNKNTLTTGGLDGLIVNTDVRMRTSIVSTYQGHNQEICGLKWSGTGQQLASGGNDNLVHIWDVAMASSSTNPIQNEWLHRFRDHTAAVKALAWCPFQSNLLATGGGTNDRCIKFWNVNTGACVNTIDTGSQVSGLLWSMHERELLSSHGRIQNQLTLWKYPSMTKVAELMGHTSRILYLAQSPNGSTVATAAADETLRFWNVFGTPEVKKAAPRAPSSLPFSNNSHIHIR